MQMADETGCDDMMSKCEVLYRGNAWCSKIQVCAPFAIAGDCRSSQSTFPTDLDVKVVY